MNPGQFFIGGFDGTKITKDLKLLIQKHKIAGFILFRRNIQSVKQVRSLIAGLQKLSDTPLFFGVDQEGGSVSRLGPPFTQLPPMAVVGEYFRRTKDVKTVTALGRILGRELRAIGFNWDYAPVVDVHSNPKNPVIGKRAFSPDPLIVIKCASALMKGLHAEGVLSCAKHFPGHGGTSADSHLTLPVVKDPGRLLWKRDFLPYRRLIPRGIVKTIMTAHVRYPELDRKNCATLSKKILTGLLRQRLDYHGLIVSDDLRMKAVSDRYGIASAAVRFFEVGGDLALVCREPEIQIKAMEYLEKQVKKQPGLQSALEESLVRIGRVRRYLAKFSTVPSLKVVGCRAHRKIVERIMAE